MNTRWTPALFEYVPVPEEECGGAAMDLNLKPGMWLRGVEKCCKNCSLLRCEIRFGETFKTTHLFAPAELKPLNPEAEAMLKLVRA